MVGFLGFSCGRPKTSKCAKNVFFLPSFNNNDFLFCLNYLCQNNRKGKNPILVAWLHLLHCGGLCFLLARQDFVRETVELCCVMMDDPSQSYL
jgi:hypothetical protein